MDLFIYIISDSNGLAMTHLARNAMDKFGINYNEKPYTNIETDSDLSNALEVIKKDQGQKIIFNSLDDPKCNKKLKDFCKTHQILSLDYGSYSLIKISEFLGIAPKEEFNLDEDIKSISHYKRLDALDFAIKYDDGRDFKGLEYCDICIIGVSRSSKTPLSVYLASIGYKVSNVPLLPDSRVPRELFEIDANKIFGLTVDKDRLQKIREQRLNSIKLPGQSNYTDLGRIVRELDHAYEVMKDLDCHIIDVTYMSIEEISEYIISKIENA